MFTWRTLRTKLLAMFLTLLLIPVLGVGIYGYSFLSQTLLDKAIDVESQNLNSQASHVRAILVETQNTLLYLSGLQAFEVLSNSSPETDLHRSSLHVLESDMQNFFSTHPMLREIAFYNVVGDPSFVITYDGDRIITGQNTIDYHATFVEQALSAPENTTHLTIDNQMNSTPNLVIGLRTNNGVILINLLSESLFQPGIDNPISETWSIHLPIQAVLQITGNENAPISPALNSHEDWIRNSRGHYQHDRFYTFYQNITVPTLQGRYNVVLFHTIPGNRLEADLNQYASAFISLTVGVLFCVIALALFSIDRFVEPICQLKESIDDIRKTQKTPMLPKKLPPDEIGKLSVSFYTMAIELEAKRQSERSLMEKLITAQEEERKRIAYDLHDGLLQQLVGARFYLNQARTIVQDSLSESALEIFSSGYESLSSAIVEGRRIMQGLHPSVLDDLGLVEALEELSYQIAKRHHWQINLNLDRLDYEVDRIVSVTIYRIAQEALNNASKHANATEVDVQLWHENGIHLIISDNGCGFDPDNPPESESGWGLRTIQERVELLYGKFKIESQPEQGTTIRICIPDKETDSVGVNNGNNSE